jgi:hypothetical protein
LSAATSRPTPQFGSVRPHKLGGGRVNSQKSRITARLKPRPYETMMKKCGPNICVLRPGPGCILLPSKFSLAYSVLSRAAW